MSTETKRKTGTDSLFGSLKNVSVPAFRGIRVQAQDSVSTTHHTYNAAENVTVINGRLARVGGLGGAGFVDSVMGGAVKHVYDEYVDQMMGPDPGYSCWPW